MGKQPQAVNTKKSTQLLLDDGSHIEADLVIFAAGITPNKEIAETAGIDCNRGCNLFLPFRQSLYLA